MVLVAAIERHPEKHFGEVFVSCVEETQEFRQATRNERCPECYGAKGPSGNLHVGSALCGVCFTVTVARLVITDIENKRQKAREAVELQQKRDAAIRLEEEEHRQRIERLIADRQRRGKCMQCGRRLTISDMWQRRDRHKGCDTFRETDLLSSEDPSSPWA